MVDCCDFLYSGLFADPVALEEALQKECIRIIGRRLKLGIKPKKMNELKLKDEDAPRYSNFTMTDFQPLHLEVDRHELKLMKAVIHDTFNAVDADRNSRPGRYSFRALPAEKVMKSGSKGSTTRLGILRRHQAVLYNHFG